MTAQTTTSRDVGERFLAAWTSGDEATARALLHPDVRFQDPLDHYDNADDYLAAIARIAPMIDRAETHRVVADGDDVCVVYDCVTATPAGTITAVDWYRLRDGRIADVRTYFDPRPLIALREGAP